MPSSRKCTLVFFAFFTFPSDQKLAKRTENRLVDTSHQGQRVFLNTPLFITFVLCHQTMPSLSLEEAVPEWVTEHQNNSYP